MDKMDVDTPPEATASSSPDAPSGAADTAAPDAAAVPLPRLPPPPTSEEKERLRKKWTGLIDQLLSAGTTTDKILKETDVDMDAVFADRGELQILVCRPVPTSTELLIFFQCRQDPETGKSSTKSGDQPSMSTPVSWLARFRELELYNSDFGNCDVGTQGEFRKLGVWVTKQRVDYKNGHLAPDLVTRLESIGFNWTIEVTWKDRYDQLVRYHSQNGHCNVNTKTGGQLGQWVGMQRQLKRAGKLGQESVDALDSIGFSWTPRNAPVPWDKRFEELKQYRETHGSCRVLTTAEGGSLGLWVANQRRGQKLGRLSQERIDRLNSIDFIWSRTKDARRAADKPAKEHFDETPALPVQDHLEQIPALPAKEDYVEVPTLPAKEGYAEAPALPRKEEYAQAPAPKEGYAQAPAPSAKEEYEEAPAPPTKEGYEEAQELEAKEEYDSPWEKSPAKEGYDESAVNVEI